MGLRFDLTDLQLFVQVAEAGSITAGAERSFLSLASASARIQGMEDALGVPLLDRLRRGVTLTPAGRVLLEHARTILLQTQRMTGELGDFAQGLKGRIRVICTSSAMHEHLPGLLGEYLQAHPKVNVQLTEALSERIVQSVLEGSADVGIVAATLPTIGASAAAVSTFDLQTIPFRDDRLVLVARREHPLAVAARSRAISIAEAEAHDIVGLVEGSALQDNWDEHAARRGVRLNYRTRLRDFEALCRIVEKCEAVALMPESAARRHALTMAIEVLRLSDASMDQRRLQVCVRSLDALPLHTQRLVEHLRAAE